MRHERVLLAVFLILACDLFSQFLFNPYKDWSGATPPFTHSQVTPYNGEYMLFTDKLFWKTHFQTVSISYKIEVLSFPFSPPCFPACTTLILSREFNLLPGYTYSSGIFTGVFNNTFSSPYSPRSLAFGSNGSISSDRILIPHTILRHTYYLHCGTDPVVDPIIDSISWIYDNTRGRMRYYPFRNDNSVGSSAPNEYDVVFRPLFFVNPASHYYNETGNNFSGNPLGYSTINYFPFGEFPKDVCSNFSSPLSSDIFFDSLSNSYSHFHPAPYSLIEAPLLTLQGEHFAGYEINPSSGNLEIPASNVGIIHKYTIDQPFDIREINPIEKVVYNPSETEIVNNTTLVLPSGYTFRNVDGRYPSASDVAAADPFGLYPDPRKVIVSSTITLDDDPQTPGIDESLSYYYIHPGCTLRIEPCVTIHDTKLKPLGPGAVIEYDPSQTFGNFVIDNSLGGTVNLLTYPNPSPACYASCLDASYFDVIDINVNPANDPDQPIVWNLSNISTVFPTSTGGTVKIAKTLRITSGTTLIIGAGLRFEFGANGRIIVERGARLLVQGTASSNVIFTAACDLMWQGMQVWGNRNQSQFPILNNIYQGYCQLNYVVLEHARNGIALTKSGDVLGHEGGIIQANNCSFLNNRRDVEFISYKYANPNIPNQIPGNASYFVNCLFETNDFLRDPLYHQNGIPRAAVAHVTMWDVKGVRFNSCQFKCSTTLFPPHLRGAGIFAIDVGIKFDPNFRNSFEGLSEGIWVIGSPASVDFVKIDGGDFNNNIHSIILEGTQYSVVQRCSLNIPVSPQMGYPAFTLEKGFDKPVGIYCLGAYDFKVQENTMNEFVNSGSGSLPCDQCSYGMVINNSNRVDLVQSGGLGVSWVYKNKVFNTSIGIQAEGENGSDNVHGVNFECNEFNQLSLFDFSISGRDPQFNGPPAIFGSLKDQGDCGNPNNQAGNIFDPSCAGGNEQLFLATNNTSPFIYSDQSGNVPDTTCTNLPQNNLQTCLPGPLNLCQSLLPPLCNLPCLVDQLDSNTSMLRSAEQLYDSLVDGGSTSSLLNFLNSSPEQGQLKYELLSISPYLSDSILIAYLELTPTPPAGHIKQVLIANSPLTSTVLTALTQLNLPGGILDQIQSVQAGISPRTELESLIDYLTGQVLLYEAEIIRYCLDDDILDSAIGIIGIGSPSNHRLLPLLLESNMVGIVDSIVSDSAGGVCDSTCLICSMVRMKLELKQENKTWLELTQQQFNTIRTTAENSPETAFNSRAVLRLLFGKEYSREPFGIAPLVPSPQRINSSATSEPGDGLQVFPNPSPGLLNVVITQVSVATRLVLINSLGLTLKEIIIPAYTNQITLDLVEFPSGIYCLKQCESQSNTKATLLVIEK